MAKRIALAYSGGLDTSVIVRWLADKGHEVVCVLVDLGQKEDVDLEEKALKSGAVKFVLKDSTEDFVSKGVFQCIKAEAKYEGRYLLGTSIARPFIMRDVIEVARQEKCDAVAHGATGKGGDQCRFELTAYALEPGIEVIAPWRIKEFRELIPGRKEAIDYAKKHGIPIVASAEKPWSTDPNIAHRSHESGMLEDPFVKPRDDMYQLITPPEKAPDNATEITIGFEDGVPVTVNGAKMNAVELLEHLNREGGRNGIGLTDMVENRFVGMKCRGVYEAPGVSILYAAHRDLEGICMDRGTMHIRDSLIPRYSELVYYGYWCTREFAALNEFVNATQKGVTGEVRVDLYKGNCTITGRKSPYSLYDESTVTMEKGGSFNQDDSTGFLKIQGLPLKIQAKLNEKLGIKFF